MFKFKLQKQLKRMSVFRYRKGWRNDVQQDALINMPDRTAGRRTDENISQILPYLLRFRFFRDMDKEELEWLSQFLVFRRLSDNQTIFHAGGSEKFFLVVHGKVNITMVVPKSQLAAQTLRRLERRKIEREQRMKAQAAKEAEIEAKVAASAEAAAANKKGKPIATPGVAAPSTDPATNTSDDPKDGPDGQKEGADGQKDAADGQKEGEKKGFDFDPLSMMEVPTKKYYIGDVHRPDIAKTGAKITSSTRAAACGHTEIVIVKRKALREALESKRVVESLAAVEMFKPMNKKAVKSLISGSAARKWRCGDVLMRDGDSVSRCIVLTKGAVQLEWALPYVPRSEKKTGSEYAAALVRANDALAKMDDVTAQSYHEHMTRMAQESVESKRRAREFKSMHRPKKYILLTTLLKGDFVGLLEVLNNLKMPYRVRATTMVEGMLLSADYLLKTPPEKRLADESSSLVLLDSLSRRIEEQVRLLSSKKIVDPDETPVTMEDVRKCENWQLHMSNLKMLKDAKGCSDTNQILKKATSLWKNLRNSKSFINGAKNERKKSLKSNAMDALVRGRILTVKPSNAIGFEQDTVHPDAKNAVVRKLVPKLNKKVEKFRYRNELSATFLTHLDKVGIHKPPKSALATTMSSTLRGTAEDERPKTSLPRLFS